MESGEIDRLVTTDGYLVVNKPGGVLTQAPPEIDSMEHRVRRWRVENGDTDRRPYVGIPHRLDRPASGVMLFGLDPKSTKALATQFEKREVSKTYWAIVSGHVDPEHGVWSDYMRKVPGEARSEIVESAHPDAQYARLKYKTILMLDVATLLEIQLETGRTHQIRLQTSSRSHPIWGDESYGATHEFGPTTTDFRKRWIALHARRLVFTDPVSKRRVDVTAPLPQSWQDVEPLAAIE